MASSRLYVRRCSSVADHSFTPPSLPPVTAPGAALGRLKLTGLADTLRTLAKNGPRDFYEGEIARSVAADIKAAADAEVRGWNASKRVNTDTLEKLKANGMQIVPPSAQLKADMKRVGDVMLKEWLEKAGPEGKQVVDAYLK